MSDRDTTSWRVELQAPESIDFELSGILVIAVSGWIEGPLIGVHDRPSAGIGLWQWDSIQLRDGEIVAGLRPFGGIRQVPSNDRRRYLAVRIAFPLDKDRDIREPFLQLAD